MGCPRINSKEIHSVTGIKLQIFLSSYTFFRSFSWTHLRSHFKEHCSLKYIKYSSSRVLWRMGHLPHNIFLLASKKFTVTLSAQLLLGISSGSNLLPLTGCAYFLEWMGFPVCPNRELTPNELMYTPAKDSHLLACVAHLKTVDLEMAEPDSSVSDYQMHCFCYS